MKKMNKLNFREILGNAITEDDTTNILARSYTDECWAFDKMSEEISSDFLKENDLNENISLSDVNRFMIEVLKAQGKIKESNFFQSEDEANQKSFYWCDEIEFWVYI